MSEYLDYEGLLRYHELIDAKKADRIDLPDLTDVVRVTELTFTNEQKALARANIGAGTISSTAHTITVKSGKKADGTTDITATSSSATSPSVTLGNSGVTAGEYGPTANQTPSYGATFNVPDIKVNAQGIVTSVVNRTVKIPASDNTDTNTATAADDILDGSNNGTEIKYAPYATQQSKLSFDTSDTAPTRTDRLNLNGYLYATKLYSGGTEVLTSHQSLSAYAPKASPALTGTPTAPTAVAGTDTTQIATTAFVQTAVSNGIATNDAMIYKTTIEGGSTGTYGALTPAASKGWTYKVSKAGKINGVAVEVGDMLICNADSTPAAAASGTNIYSTVVANWDYIQTNIDGAVTGPSSSTDGNLASYNGATGKVIKDSGLTTTNVSDAVSKKHSHTTLTLSTTAQAYDGTNTLALPSSDPYTSARTPASHAHGNIANGGTLTDTAAAAAGNDYVVIRDADNNKILTSTIKGTDVADAVDKKHVHTDITLSKTALTYDGTHTIVLPSSDPYTSARTPSSHTHGNIQNGGTLQTNDITIANGDKLVVTDSSDSNKVARTSISFDGSTTTTALTPKGTFEAFSKFSGSYTDLTNKPTIPTVYNAKFSIKGAGTEVASTTANASAASSIDIVGSTTVTVTPDAANNKITLSASMPTISHSAVGTATLDSTQKIDALFITA